MSFREIEPILAIGHSRGKQPDAADLNDLIDSPGYTLLILTREEIDEIYTTLILPDTVLDTFTIGNLQQTHARLITGNCKPDAWNLFRMTVVMAAVGTEGKYRCANLLNTFAPNENGYAGEEMDEFYFSVKFDKSK